MPFKKEKKKHWEKTYETFFFGIKANTNKGGKWGKKTKI